MKKIFALLILSSIFVCVNAQTIWKQTDDMTDKSYYHFIDSKGDSARTILTEDGINGLKIMPILKNGNKVNTLYVKMFHKGMGCVEGGFMIIKFTDESKIKIINWKSFNCDGEFYFDIDKYKSELSTKPIDKIMVENGRDYKSETQKFKNPNYFIELYQTMANYKE